jgi:hypothetical protein
MTTHETKRCQHCRSTYQYQWTGYGCLDKRNDPTYCTECKTVILSALAGVPKRFDLVFQETSEVSLDRLLQWERIEDKEREEKFLPKRIAVPMFSLGSKSGESHQAFVKGRDHLSGRLYLYQYWDGEEDEASIRVEMEKNLMTGELTVWKEYG